MTKRRQRPDAVVVEVGGQVMGANGPAKVLGFSRQTDGAMSVLLDYGDRTERRSWSEVLDEARCALEELPTVTPDQAILSELSPAERADIEQTARHLRQVMTGSVSGTAEQDRRLGLLDARYDPRFTTEGQRVDAKVAEMKSRGASGWSRAAVYRKLRAFESDGMRGLIHGSRRTTSDYLAQFDPRIVDTVRSTLEADKALARSPIRAQLAVVHAELASAGLGADLTVHRLKRIMSEVSRGLGLHHDAAGRHRHQIKPTRVYGTRPVSRPGEIVQIDATRTNVHLRGPDGRWLPGNILTAIDVASRDIAAMRVVVGAVSAREVGLLLFDMGQPALPRAGYPHQVVTEHGRPRQVVVNADPGVDQNELEAMKYAKPALAPTTIVLDRGSENVSNAVLATCTRLGIDVIWAPPGAGYAKGFIESAQRGSDYLASLFESYKGNAPDNHPKRVEELPQFTRGMFNDLLWEWFNTVYRHKPHRGLIEQYGPGGPQTPAAAFELLMNNGGHIELDRDPYAYLDFLPETTARVQDYGLRVNSRVYASPDTVELRKYAQAGLGVRARNVLIRYDPYDFDRIFLRHPTTGVWLCVPLLDRQRGTQAPYSDLAEDAPSSQVRAPLTEQERVLAESALRSEFTTRADAEKDNRLRRSVEAARKEVHDLDLITAGDAVLDLIAESERTAHAWTPGVLTGHDSYDSSSVSALLADAAMPTDLDDEVPLYLVRDDDEELGISSFDAEEDRIYLDDYYPEDSAG